MKSDLPASLAVGDGAFERRGVLAFRCCAALRESARELHEVVYGLCEWSEAISQMTWVPSNPPPQPCLRDMCLSAKKLVNRNSIHVFKLCGTWHLGAHTGTSETRGTQLLAAAASYAPHTRKPDVERARGLKLTYDELA